jgi:hypothetical protein
MKPTDGSIPRERADEIKKGPTPENMSRFNGCHNAPSGVKRRLPIAADGVFWYNPHSVEC